MRKVNSVETAAAVASAALDTRSRGEMRAMDVARTRSILNVALVAAALFRVFAGAGPRKYTSDIEMKANPTVIT